MGRKEAPHVIELIEAQTPRAFVTVEELRTARNGALPTADRYRTQSVRR